ncbi:hypothetical protein Tco_1372126 [Tanacetum coccineum]
MNDNCYYLRSIWETFGGKARDLGSIQEETGQKHNTSIFVTKVGLILLLVEQKKINKGSETGGQRLSPCWEKTYGRWVIVQIWARSGFNGDRRALGLNGVSANHLRCESKYVLLDMNMYTGKITTLLSFTMSAKDAICTYTCVLTSEELAEFLELYPVPPEYNVMLPKSTQTMYDAPDGYIGL